jgi:anti-sigma B factor antagonist
MPLFRTSTHASGAQIFHFQGRVTFGRETEACRQTLKSLLSRGDRNIVFDLSQVEAVDSAGIGFLVSCLTTVKNEGGRLRLAQPQQRVEYVLGITKLYTVFEVAPTVEQAVQK